MSENKKLGQESAFPNVETYNPNNLECNCTFEIGMSKRFYAACAAMQGLISHYGVAFEESHIQKAYYYADELLKQENE